MRLLHIDNIICSSQIINYNPLIQDSLEKQLQYFRLLQYYIKKFGLYNRKLVKSQLQIYRKAFSDSKIKLNKDSQLEEKYKYLLIFDFLFITAFDVSSKKNISTLTAIAKENHYERSILPNIISYCSGNFNAWDNIKKSKAYKLFKQYLSLFKENFEFMKKKKFEVLITATMSAGKSTLINALCGKNITLSQNMACTSQLHSIFSKPFEDNYTCKRDYALTLDATSKELLNDNPKNKTGRIKAGTYFRGNLAGRAIILNDTPGVNSSQNDEHRQITHNIIKQKKYDLIIYLLNATQLGTNDDEEHLMFVKNNIGNRPIIFILNKIDELNSEDEDANQIIKKHTAYLSSLGYKNPILCPLSSRYGLLAKKSKFEKLSRFESRELDRVMMNFEDANYSVFYKDHFKEISINEADNELDEFLINCGMEYVEKIICNYIANKENKNG